MIDCKLITDHIGFYIESNSNTILSSHHQIFCISNLEQNQKSQPLFGFFVYWPNVSNRSWFGNGNKFNFTWIEMMTLHQFCHFDIVTTFNQILTNTENLSQWQCSSATKQKIRLIDILRHAFHFTVNSVTFF